jgi:hypothetical protein
VPKGDIRVAKGSSARGTWGEDQRPPFSDAINRFVMLIVD